MKESEILIQQATDRLAKKLDRLNLDALVISDYNKRYLKDYITNFTFFMPLYKSLLEKVMLQLTKPIAKSTFVDYGGGCGLLSFLAIELGFQKVIYNDIYKVSTEDVQVISKALHLDIDYFITGDITQFVHFISAHKIAVDHICSFDVLEHIYNLDSWFLEVNNLPKPFSLCFMTSANSSNPYINRKLKKIHYKAEYLGVQKEKGWKERDSSLAFLEIRKKIISENISIQNKETITVLAQNTRGLFGNDILVYAKKQLAQNTFKDAVKHPTNTCDPITGNWAEHSIDIKNLAAIISSKKTKVQFTNSFYSYSNAYILNLPKALLNSTMKILGKQNLFLSPSYTLEIVYEK